MTMSQVPAKKFVAEPSPAAESETGVPPTGAARLVGIGKSALLGRFYWVGPTLLTFAITVAWVSRPSLWADELATWSATRRSWSQLWDLLGNVDAVAAPYYVLMHFWVRLFGESELSLRLPSVIAVSVAAGSLTVLGRRLFSVRVGVIAGVVFAFIPGVSRIGQEARVTAFTVMFAVLATLALVSALDKPSWWRWVRYTGAAIALGAMHLIALLFLAVHAVFVAWKLREVRDRRPLWWLAAAAGALIVLAPLAYISRQQVNQLIWVAVPDWPVLMQVPELVGSALLGGVVVGLALTSLPRGILLLPWLVLPPILLFVISVLGPQSYWVSRYLNFLLPAFALLVALSLSRMTATHGVLVFLTFLLIAVPLHAGVRAESSHAAYDGRKVAQHIASRIEPGDVAMFADLDAAGTRNLVRYYGPSQSQLPDALAIGSAAEIGGYDPIECSDPAPCLTGAKRVWLIRRYLADEPFDKMFNQTKQSYLREQFSYTQEWRIGAVRITLLDRRV